MQRPELRDRSLYLIFTPGLCRLPAQECLQAALEGGVELVQWRDKQRDPLGLAQALALCGSHGVPLIVNDQVDLAIQAGAQGAHVGQDDLPADVARARMPEHMLLGVSTHDLAQLSAARADGADHIGIGPCNPTRTKGYAEGLAEAQLREMFARAEVPAYAIGGITAEDIPRLRRCGARSFAVGAAILAAADPAAAARELQRAIRA